MKESTKMKTLYLAALSLSVALMLSMSASAGVVWSENFDSYADGSILRGQVGPNGQTWREFDLWNGAFQDMQVNTTAGQGGTLGAGPSAGGENAVAIDLGQELSSGILQIEFDLYIGTGRQSGPQWWLKDAESGNNISLALDWMDNATGGMDPQSGFHTADSGTNPPNLLWDTEITAATQNMHGSYTVDLDNKTVRYMMTSVEEGSVADSGVVNYEEDYSPEQIQLYLGAMSSSNSRGYDNIVISVIPEPTSLLLIFAGLCCLGASWRRR